MLIEGMRSIDAQQIHFFKMYNYTIRIVHFFEFLQFYTYAVITIIKTKPISSIPQSSPVPCLSQSSPYSGSQSTFCHSRLDLSFLGFHISGLIGLCTRQNYFYLTLE